MPERRLGDVLRAHADRLMSLSGVTGVAEGATADGAPCLLVLVVRRTAELEACVPARLEGYPVELLETGELEARGDPDAR